MKAKIAGLAVLLLLLAAAAFWLMRSRPATPQIATEQTATQVTEKPAAAETEKMQAAGKILGLAIGDPIEAARQRLDPLRVNVHYTPDAKEKTGRRIYWKLRETEFDSPESATPRRS